MNDKKLKRYGLLVTIICFFVFFIGSYAQYQLSPLSLQVMEELSINESQFSMLFTASLFPAIFLSLISGLLVDRFGARKSVGAALIIAAIGTVGRIFAGGFGVMFACMLISGTGCLFITSSSAKILVPYYSGAKLGAAVGIVTAGSNVAMFVATATTAWFPSTHAAWIFAGVIAVILLACWFLFIKKEGSAGEEAVEAAPIGESLRTCLKNKYIWLDGITLLLMMLGQVAVASFMPQVLQQNQGMSATVSGYMTSAWMLGAIFGATMGPRFFDKTGRSRVYVIACIVVMSLGVAFAWLITSPVLLAVVLFICGAALCQFMPILYAFPVTLPEIGSVYAATANGLAATLQMIGASLIPSYILAPIFGSNFGGMFLTSGILCLISVVTISMLPMFGKTEQ